MNRETGITAVDLLQIAFIILKVCGVIKWSWWWVLSPIWIALIFLFVVSVILAWLSK